MSIPRLPVRRWFLSIIFLALTEPGLLALVTPGQLASGEADPGTGPASHSSLEQAAPGALAARTSIRSSGSTGWNFLFQSSTTSQLTVVVRDRTGVPRQGAVVDRYGDSGLLDRRTTDGAGRAVWESLQRGTWRFDVVVPGTDTFDNAPAFWTRAVTTVAQPVQVVELVRNWPVVERVRVVRDADGQDVTGGSVNVGERIRVIARVQNPSGAPRLTRVRCRLDRDRAAPWDGEFTTDAVSVGTAGDFSVTFTPTLPGIYLAAVRVETQENGKTDFRDWTPAIEAVSQQGLFELSAAVLDFGRVEVGATATRSLRIRNLGSGPLQLGAQVTQGSGFELLASGSVDVPGASEIEVLTRFSPGRVGAFTGHLMITSGDLPGAFRWVQLQGSGSTAGEQPVADFTWDPQTPLVGQPVRFQSAPGRLQQLSWDFESDGQTDSREASPLHTFTHPGRFQVQLLAENAYGRDVAVKGVQVSGGTGPAVTRVQRQYPGFFLQGADLGNLFTVGVDWMGSPGQVGFSVNGAAPDWRPGDAQGVTRSFNMGREFSPGFSPSRLVITPRNAAGITGNPWTENVHVFPWPRWLQLAAGGQALRFTAGAGEMNAEFSLLFPRTPLAQGCDPAQGKHRCLIRIPDWVPVFGGAVGLTETWATLDGRVSSLGRGSIGLVGRTGFAAMGRWLLGEASGTGNLAFSAGKGLELTDGSLRLRLSGTIANDFGILELIPGLKSVAKKPVLREFNRMVRLGSQVSPSLDFAARFQQDQSGDLAFSQAEGKLGIRVQGSLYGSFFRIVKAHVWLAGDGSIVVGLPEPVFRELTLKLQAGARITINYFLGTWRQTVTFNAGCRWSPGSGIRCGTGNAYAMTGVPDGEADRLRLIEIDYDRFGPYSMAQPVPLVRSSAVTTPANTEQTSLVSNLFPGASPFLTGLGNGSLLLWEHQDRGDQVLQSTEIAFSWHDGTQWSAPALVANDTRAELDPVACGYENGAVGAWTRSSDPAFSDVPEDLEALAPFLRQMEIVTARFDPNAGTWTVPSPLTFNTSFETDLQMARDGSGRVWLTWLENPQGEILSTSTAPSALRSSIWDGTSWTAPATIVANLVGVGSHALFASGPDVVVLVAANPDPELDGDEHIDIWTLQGTGWAHGGTFAGGDGSVNALPTGAFDAFGRGHVVWVRDGDLVHATLDDPTPRIVRERSSGLGFFHARLLAEPSGHFVLVFQRETEVGPGDLFALVHDASSGGWSEDRRLTDQPAASAYDVSGYFDRNGLLHLAYLNNYVESVSETVSIEGEDWQINGIPRDGRTDLELLERSLIVDLALAETDVALLPAAPEAGQSCEVRARVHNAGDFPVADFTVGVYRSPGIPGPVLLAAVTVDGLNAGGVAEVVVPFEFPSFAIDLLVVVDRENQIHEFSESNNSAWIPVANRSPVADPVASATSGLAPLTVAFDGSTSVDPDGSIIAYEWDIPAASTKASGISTSFTFDQPGVYSVALTVTDDRGRSSTSWVRITVEAQRHYFPFYRALGGEFTGFAVSNHSAQTALLEWRLLSADGELQRPPRVVEVAPGSQLALLGRELFELEAGSAQGGWIELRSDNPEIAGFFLYGNGVALDGSVESLRYSRRLNFTRIYEGSNAYRGQPATTWLSIANPADEEVVLDLALHVRAIGGMGRAGLVTRRVSAGGYLGATVTELFGEGLNVQDGYIVVEVREGKGVTGFSLVQLAQGTTTLGLGAVAPEESSTRLYSAQLAAVGGLLYTNLRLVNLSGESRKLSLVGVDRNGEPFGPPAEVELSPGDALQEDVVQLLGLGSLSVVLGSLQVVADGPGVVGDVVFGDPNFRYAAALPLQIRLVSRALFSHVANIPGEFYTGLAIHNPGSRSASVRIDVHRSDGGLAGSQVVEMLPGHRLSQTLTEWVPGVDGVIGGYVRIESSEPLVLQQLFGDFLQTHLAAVPPKILE